MKGKRKSWALASGLAWLFSAAILVSVLGLGWFWYHLFSTRVATLPEVSQAVRTVVTAPSREAGRQIVEIGRVELGQTKGSDSAEERHIGVVFEDGLPLGLMNLGRLRRLDLRYEKLVVRHSDRLLRTGDRFTTAGVTFEVVEARPDQITIAGPEDPVLGRLVTLPRLYFQAGKSGSEMLRGWLSDSLTIGGVVPHRPDIWDDGNVVRYILRANVAKRFAPAIVLPLDQIGADTLRIEKTKNNGWRLRLAKPRFVSFCPANEECFELGRQLWPLSTTEMGSLETVTAGRTTYRVKVEGKRVVFEPVSRPHWLSQARGDVIDVVGLERTRPFRRALPAGGGEISLGVGVLAILFELGPEALFFGVVWLILGVYRQSSQTAVRNTSMLGLAALMAVAAGPGMSTISLGLRATGTFILLASLPRLVRFGVTVIRAIGGFLRRPLGFGEIGYKNGDSLPPLLDWLSLVFALSSLAYLSVVHIPAPINPVTGDEHFSAMAATIALYTITGLLLATRYAKTLAPLFWVSFMVVVAIGLLSGSQLNFGRRYGLYLVLYSRHLAILSVIAYLCGIIALYPRDALVMMLRRGLRGLRYEWSIPMLSIILGGVGLATAALAWLSWPGINGAGPTRLTEALPEWAWISPRLIQTGVLVFLASIFLIAGWLAGRGAQERGGGIAVPSLWITVPSLLLGGLLFATPETGIGGLQPSEMGKTWLALLLSALIAIWIENRIWRLPYERRRTLIWPALFFAGVLVLFAAGSFVNSDLSPIAIVVFMALTIASFLTLVIVTQGMRMKFFFVALVLILVLSAQSELISVKTAAWMVLAMLFWRLAIGPRKEQGEFLTLRMVRLRWYRGRETFEKARASWTGWRFWQWLIRRQGALLVVAVGFVVALWGWQQLPGLLERLTDSTYLQTYRSALPNTVQERLLSWTDSRLTRVSDGSALIIEHPDLALQVRESREVVAVTGCGFIADILAQARGALLFGETVAEPMEVVGRMVPQGASAQFCDLAPILPEPGETREFVLQVPAIQDDFAGTFVIASLGRDALLVLLPAQIVMIALMWAIAAANAIVGFEIRSAQGVSMFGALFVANTSLVLLSQFLMAWGNVFGLFPVVGQPMTFLSFGGSHHLFFAVPAIVATVLAAVMVETDQSMRAAKRFLLTGREVRAVNRAVS